MIADVNDRGFLRDIALDSVQRAGVKAYRERPNVTFVSDDGNEFRVSAVFSKSGREEVVVFNWDWVMAQEENRRRGPMEEEAFDQMTLGGILI